MKLHFILLSLFISLLLFQGIEAHAQEAQSDTSKYRIVMNNGNVFVGKILETTETHLIFLSDELGEIKIVRSEIKQQQFLDPKRMIKGTYWPRLPHISRYFFTPTSYNLKKGEGNYQNIWVLFNVLSYGVTDHISVGAGLVPSFLFQSSTFPVWLSAKAGYPIIEHKFGIGLSSTSYFITGESDRFTTLGPFMTYGSEDKNITAGIVWGFVSGSEASSPIINVSGKYRLNRKTFAMFEIFTVDPEVDPFVTFGFRTLFGQIAWDFNLTYVGSEGDGIFFPVVGISVPFGNFPR